MATERESKIGSATLAGPKRSRARQIPMIVLLCILIGVAAYCYWTGVYPYFRSEDLTTAVAAPQAPAGSEWIEVLVVDDREAALPGANVTLGRTQGNTSSDVVSNVTNAEGLVRFEALPLGAYYVYFRREGYYTNDSNIGQIVMNQRNTKFLHAYGVVRGRAVDALGAAISARLTIRSNGTVMTNASLEPAGYGTFEVKHLNTDREYEITVEAPGYGESLQRVRPQPADEARTIDFTMKAPRKTRARLVDAESGAAVAEASIRVGDESVYGYDWQKFDAGETGLKEVVYSAEKGFEFSEGDKAKAVYVKSKGYVNRLFAADSRTTPTADGSYVFAMTKGARVSGFIERKGKRVANARVTISRYDAKLPNDRESFMTQSGPDGGYSIDGLAGGDWRVVAEWSEDGSIQRDRGIHLEEAKSQTLDLDESLGELKLTGAAFGDDGSPVRVSVSLTDLSGPNYESFTQPTGVGGVFEFRGLKPGKYFLSSGSINRGKEVVPGISKQIEISGDTEVTLNYARQNEVTGTVSFPADFPPALTSSIDVVRINISKFPEKDPARADPQQWADGPFEGGRIKIPGNFLGDRVALRSSAMLAHLDIEEPVELDSMLKAGSLGRVVAPDVGMLEIAARFTSAPLHPASSAHVYDVTRGVDALVTLLSYPPAEAQKAYLAVGEHKLRIQGYGMTAERNEFAVTIEKGKTAKFQVVLTPAEVGKS